MCITCNFISGDQVGRSRVLKELYIGVTTAAHLLTVKFGTILADIRYD